MRLNSHGTETPVTFSSRLESVFMAWSRRTTLISSLIIIAAGLVLIILGNVERIASSLRAPRNTRSPRFRSMASGRTNT